MGWRRRRDREADLDRELRSDLELEALEQEEKGLSPEDARYAAKRALGNAGLIKEEIRAAWGWRWLDVLVQDTRFAIRNFARRRAATAIIIFTLAAGIGANTAVFSIFDAVLLRQPPYRDPDRLVSILDLQKKAGGRATFFDLYLDYDNWKKNSTVFDGFAAITWAGNFDRTLSGTGPARRVRALPVTADYFTVLGTPPLLGRTFLATDQVSGCTAVLSHEFWRNLKGGDANLIGKPLRLDDQDCTVIGVMPPGFAVYPNPPSMIWTLMPVPPRPDQFGVFVVGRLKRGVSMAQAQNELVMLHYRLHQHDRWGEMMEPRIYELQSEFTWLTSRNLKLSLIVLFAAVSIVLLICCANVSNLLLSQSLSRRREMAIRVSLGSGRIRVLRQLLTESLLLSVAAMVCGAALAWGAVDYFRLANPVELPPATVVKVDGRILAFTIVLSAVTTVVFGLAPAWKGSRTDLNTALKASGRSSSENAGTQRFASFLIVAEVALTLVLLTGAGLLLQSVSLFGATPLGFTPDGLLTSSIELPKAGYATSEERIRFYGSLLDHLLATHQIEEGALSTALPTSGTGTIAVLAVEGRPDPEPNTILDTGTQTVSPQYFRVMRLPLKEGRLFDDRDDAHSAPAAIVNEALVARYFPNEDPIGKAIRQFDGPETNRPWLRIVGVVGDEKRTDVAKEMSWTDIPVMYLPWPQNSQLSAVLLFRTRDMRLPSVDLIQKAAGDADVTVGDLDTVPHAIAKILAYPQFRAVLLTAFAALALLLAFVGLYGVLSRLVARRTHEIGIRMALGAQQSAVLMTIAKQGMLLTAVGVVLGLASVWGLTQLLKALLYGVSATDPTNLVLVTLVLLVSAALATFLPARRAMQVDPMIALREE